MGPVVIEIRGMTQDDVSAVVQIEQSLYPDPWSTSSFEEELAAADRVYVVAIAAGAVIGYAGLMIVGDEGHVSTVSVEEERQGEGVGTRMLLALVDAATSRGARHLTLEVRASNTRAQGLYRRFGMAPVGFRRRYYRSEDALIMWANDIGGSDYRQRIERIRQEVG